MIPRINSNAGRSFKGAAAYYTHDLEADTAERVRFVQCENMLTQDPEKAAKVMAWTAEHWRELREVSGGRVTKTPTTGPVYTLSLSWAAHEEPSDAQMIAFARDAMKRLGVSEHEAVIEERPQFVENADHLLLIVLADVLQALDDTADARVLVFEERFFAVGREADVDLALVARVDAALDERALAVFQGADDARHLGGQDAEQALDVADDHRAVRLEEREGEELDLLEVAAAAPAAQRGKTDVCHDFEKLVCDIFDTMTGADGHGSRLCA